jgi:hypothetical protein
VRTNRLLSFQKSKSKLLYDWQVTANQFVLAPSSLRLTTRYFFQLNPCGFIPYVTSSLACRWVCLLWIGFAFVKRTYRIYSILLKVLPCALYTSPLSSGFGMQNVYILRTLCYNGSLVTWTVVSLTTVKFKPLIFLLSFHYILSI